MSALLVKRMASAQINIFYYKSPINVGLGTAQRRLMSELNGQQSTIRRSTRGQTPSNTIVVAPARLRYGWLAFFGVPVVAGGLVWAVTGDSTLGDTVRRSFVYQWISAQASEIARPFSQPNREKLLPDWPYFPNVPPGTPCPPTLVLDLEGTLCTSTWDPKFGWRHVKRPGVEKFLKEMSRYDVL